METALQNDAELVAESLAGDKDAFRRIVERHQTLICSLAYCATGSVSQSEDLAQETFVTAWKDLAQLREPAKLRSWLCAIVRFRIGKQYRKKGRDPIHLAEPLAAADSTAAPEALPSAQAITNEENIILWRSLEQIPEMYREPLVLFYREHQSIETVAANLDLTEDAVKQRLSRGRKMLQEEVQAFVEGALARTNPGQLFTLGVLAALPVTLASSAKAATLAAAAAKGGASVTGTSFISVILGILSGPGLGFLFGFLGWRESLKNTKIARERTLIKRYGLLMLMGGILFFVTCSAFSGYMAPRLWGRHPVMVLTIGWAICALWVIFVFGLLWRHKQKMTVSREEARRSHPELFQDEHSKPAQDYRSRATLLGLPLIHWRSFSRARARKSGGKIQPAIGWIAGGEVAFGIIYASGGIAVGGISTGGLSIGILALGGFSIGLVALGGFALGAIALGGGAIGWVASGGLALGWHAALGGMVGAHDLACGGAALGNHVNDAVARGFFQNHRWLDFSESTTRTAFWLLCFGPMSIQMLAWMWWRRKMAKRARQQSKIITLLVAVIVVNLTTVMADPISERITVTVRGKGPDVVLIPGLACSGAVWDATATQLEGHYRLHIVQVAGFAGAPARANAKGPVIQPVVDAIDAYIKTNQLKSPKVIGHSLGGLMGLMLAVQHPEDSSKLMIVDALPFYSALYGANSAAEAAPYAVQMRDNILAETQEAYAQSETNVMRSLVKSPVGCQAATAWAVASDKSVVARALDEDMTTDLRARLHEIKISVTMLYPWDPLTGMPQAAFDKLYHEAYAPLTNTTVVRIDGSFHFIMLDQPEAFAKQVDAFLK